MKKLLFIGLLSIAASAYADDFQIGVVGPFGGLNNTDNSLIIPANAAQDLLNVDITPNGKSVKKREGFATALTLGLTTSPIHGVHVFYDSSGNDVVLAFNERRITSSIAGSTTTVIYSTATNETTWQCVDSQGFAYCANTARNGLFKTNGVTVAPLPITSTGTIVAVTPERLVQAGFELAPNRLDVSKANDFTTWTVGSAATDPITFTITSPGSAIKHVTYAHRKIYWFKESSFGYILEAPALADWEIRIVSSEIGTLDNTSVQDTDGNLYFRGQEGHIYVTDGASVKKLSRDIGGTVSAASSRVENSWEQTTESDFEAGSLSNLDSNSVSGQLTLTLNAEYDVRPMYGVANNNTLSTTSCANYYSATSFTSTVNFLLSGITIQARNSGSPGNYKIALVNDSGSLPIGSVLGFNTLYSTNVTGSFGFYKSTISPSVVISSGTRYWVQAIPLGTCDSSNHLQWWRSPQSAAPIAPSGEFGAAGSSVSTSNYYRFIAHGSTYAATGTYLSAVKNAPNLTSWDAFEVSKINQDGSHTFSLRSATNPFTVNSSTPTFSVITDGSVPTISTGTYFQIKDVITTSSGSTTPVLYDFTQNWFEGGAGDKCYAIFFDEKVMFSVAVGAGQSVNNRVLIYDLITPGWTIYDLASNGFYKRNQGLYFGSASSGYVFKLGDTNNDNGSAINAYWKSKDFFMDSPFVDKEFVNLSVFADSVSASSATITSIVNGSSSTAVTMALGNSNTYARKNQNLPLGRVGNTLSVQFGNNASDQSFELFGIQYGYRPKSWKPE